MVSSSIQIHRNITKPASFISGTPIWEWNLATDAIWINESFTAAFGCSAIASGNEFWKHKVHPDDKEQVAGSIWRVIANAEKSWSAAYRLLRADGSYASVHNQADTILEAGSVIRMIGSLTELTGQQEAEEESEQWMRFALDAAKLGTWDFNPITGVTKWDCLCRQLNGLTEGDEITYDNILANIHPEDVEQVKQAIADALNPAIQADYSAEFRVIGAEDKIERWVRAKGKAHFYKDGTARRLSGIIQDITHEVKDRKDQQMLMKLIESNPEMMGLSGADGQMIYLNRAGRQLTGIATDYDIKRVSIKDFYTPEHFAVLEKEITPHLYKNGSWSAIVHLQHAVTGEIIPCHADFITITDPVNGKVLMRGVTMRDLRTEYKAQAEQLKLFTLVDNSVGLMSVLGMDKKNSYINKAGKKLLGIDADADVSQIPISDFHTPEQIEFVGREVLSSVMGKGSWSGRFAAKHTKTGEIIPLENNCLRIDDPITGQPIAIGAVMRDLRPEMEAQKEQRRLLFLLENTSDFVSLSDVEGNVEYVNTAGRNLLGLNDANEAKRHNSEYVMPGETERLNKEINKQLFETGSWSGEVFYRHFTTGEPVLVQGTTMIVYDPVTQLPQGRASIARDIRAERAAQKALMESENLFRSIATAVPLILWMSDTKGQITYINQRWTEFAGLPEQPFNGAVWHEAILAEDREKLLQAYAHAMQNATTLSTEYRVKRTDGKIIWTYTLGQPQFDEEGNYTGFLGYTTDITEQKELQRQKDEFIGIASHELKTPVTSLKAYTQLLETMFRKRGDDREAGMLGKMDVQITKLSNLIADLLDVTKIQAGKLQFNDAFFDFNKLADEVVEEVQRTTRKHTINKKFSTGGMVFGDEHRIGQVITNFITNAIKYSPDATEIIVCISRTKEEVRLCVQDFGIGIAKDKQARVFEQFYRVSGGRQDTFPGLGLGLYISAEIIRREGGKIGVESIEGKGSSFYFSLPVGS